MIPRQFRAFQTIGVVLFIIVLAYIMDNYNKNLVLAVMVSDTLYTLVEFRSVTSGALVCASFWILNMIILYISIDMLKESGSVLAIVLMLHSLYMLLTLFIVAGYLVLAGPAYVPLPV